MRSGKIEGLRRHEVEEERARPEQKDVLLEQVLRDLAGCLVAIDQDGDAFRAFQRGVGPDGEPQLLRLAASRLKTLPAYGTNTATKRTPDLLIPGRWAIECKIARPFGDNGKEAEDWSVNLLHPYPGNVSSIGDCHKLLALRGTERRAICVIGYEHSPAKIDLTPLVDAFEAIAIHVAKIHLGARLERRCEGLRHPVHQVARLFAWEVLGYLA